VVQIINVIDDHSRVCADSLAVAVATTEAAWVAFSHGCERLGLPRGCLSDNGLIFSGRLRGFEVYFETQLRSVGVRPITSRPYHPQTCGKVERFQQTLKRWLRRHPAATLAQLQAHLDAFRDYYNHHRPHRGIGRATPWARFVAMTPAAAPAAALPAPRLVHAGTVNDGGTIQASRWKIGIGVAYAGRPATMILDGTRLLVFVEGRLVRDLELDTSRYYQPTSQTRTRRKPLHRHTTVSQHGTITAGPWIIALGTEHAGKVATVAVEGNHVSVNIDGQQVRDFDADPNRRYQPNGRPRGGPRRRPH
jgi:hypothetical protein